MTPHSPTIAVVGAGLAGMTTAYCLHEAGYEVQVYEARDRVGGRAYSVYVNGLINELGGNNIYDGGEAINLFNLARELVLEAEIVEHQIFRCPEFNGVTYSNKDLKEHQDRLGDITTAIHTAAAGAKNMKEIIDTVFAKDDLLKFYHNNPISRYEGSDTSILNTSSVDALLSFIGLDSSVEFATIKGGNALIPTHIAEKSDGSVHLNLPLIQLTYDNHGYTLHFANGHIAAANCVVLAVPAAVYADIQIDASIIPPTQKEAIQRVQYAPASKIIVPVKHTADSNEAVISNTFAA